jgi:hypothetical protein
MGMGNATSFGRVGVLLSIGIVVSLLASCGEVTAAGAEETQACAKKRCAGMNCPPPDQPKHESDAGAGCVTGSDGSTGGGPGSTPSGSAGGTGGAVPTELAQFPCTVCRRAENCCRAEGLSDCGYTAACASATNAQQMEFYLVLCRAVFSAATGAKAPADVCGF